MSDQTPEAPRPLPADLPAVSRLAAGNALRESLKNTAGLGPIADAAAVFVATSSMPMLQRSRCCGVTCIAPW